MVRLSRFPLLCRDSIIKITEIFSPVAICMGEHAKKHENMN
jgi:hypothetical protein